MLNTLMPASLEIHYYVVTGRVQYVTPLQKSKVYMMLYRKSSIIIDFFLFFFSCACMLLTWCGGLMNGFDASCSYDFPNSCCLCYIRLHCFVIHDNSCYLQVQRAKPVSERIQPEHSRFYSSSYKFSYLKQYFLCPDLQVGYFLVRFAKTCCSSPGFVNLYI